MAFTKKNALPEIVVEVDGIKFKTTEGEIILNVEKAGNGYRVLRYIPARNENETHAVDLRFSYLPEGTDVYVPTGSGTRMSLAAMSKGFDNLTTLLAQQAQLAKAL